MPERQRYLRAKEIAQLLGVDVRTIRRWIANGALPSGRLGGARLVAEADLLQVIHPDDQPPQRSPGAKARAESVDQLGIGKALPE